MRQYQIHDETFLTDENIVLLEQTGSFAHGTRIPPADGGIDDIDLMGVVLPPRRYIIGLSEWGSSGTRVIKNGPLDIVLYEIRKFVGLLLKGNPNVLGMLFPPDDCLLAKSEAGEILLSLRPAFIGKHVHAAFKGYAQAQLKKMFATEGAFEGYMGAKRKDLVLKHGYDTKNAAHLIRLLNMDIEFLATGQLNVRRPNACFLKDIKAGNIPLAELRRLAEDLFVQADKAYEMSMLPEKPNEIGVENILVNLLGTHCASNTSKYIKGRI